MEKGSRIVLQERDLKILSEINESPACTRKHIAQAFFGGSYDGAKKRLQQLFHAGLIENNDASSTRRTILRLTRKSLDLLANEGLLVSPNTAKPNSPRLHFHEKMLADCRLSFKTAIESLDGFLLDFHTKAEQTSFAVPCDEHWCTEIVRPDAMCAFQGMPRTHY